MRLPARQSRQAGGIRPMPVPSPSGRAPQLPPGGAFPSEAREGSLGSNGTTTMGIQPFLVRCAADRENYLNPPVLERIGRARGIGGQQPPLFTQECPLGHKSSSPEVRGSEGGGTMDK